MSWRGTISNTHSARVWLKWSGIIICGAATVFAICINLQASASSRRIDLTSDHRYTLSAVTQKLLASIKEPVSIHVLLSHTDPLANAFSPIVDSYSSSSHLIRVNWIDPDRDTGRFLALQSELGVMSGASKDGKSLTDSVAVLEQGKARSYVTIDDVEERDPATGETEPLVEQALTGAIYRLLDTSRPLVCFSQGHRERALDDTSPEGLSELKARLLADSSEVKVLDLEDSRESLAACALLVVPEPELPLSTWVISNISDYRDRLGPLWVMSGTVPDETGKVRGVGLETIMPKIGVSLASDVVIENDPSRRLPDGFGESFFAQPNQHAVTRMLSAENPNRSLRVLVSLAPTIDIATGAPVSPLLTTSEQAQAIQDVGSYLRSAPHVPARRAVPLTLAIAAELGETPAHAKRRVVLSPASIAINRALRSPGLVGNRAFVDGTVAWLLARSAGVDIMVSRKAVPPFELAENDLKRLEQYVLLIMPGAALLLALAVMITTRRRKGT